MSLTTDCSQCGFQDDRYINEPLTIQELIRLLGKDHQEESPNCDNSPQNFVVSGENRIIDFQLATQKRGVRENSILEL